MPFGLDLKSMIVAIIIVLFVFPWVSGMLNNRKAVAA